MEKNVETIITDAVTEGIQNPTKAARKLIDLVLWLLRVISSSLERFYWDNGFSKAASLAYTSLLSLVPVTFVGFGFLASFAVSNQDLLKIREFIFRQFVPNQATVSIILEKLADIDQALNSSSFSVYAIAFFAVTALLLINSIEYALNEIWQVYEPRTIAQRILIFCAILVIAPVLAVSAYYTTKLRVEPFLMGIEALAPFSTFFNSALSFSIDLLAFFVLYYLVPKAPVRLGSALFGAVVTSILFDLAKFYFTVYIVRFSSYDKIYGALAVIPIFLFWLYITWSIILFGCELCYQFQYLPKAGRIFKKQVTSVGDGALLLACQCLVSIARAFERGDRAPNEQELTERLGCSSIVLKPVLEKLKREGIICQGDTREMPLILQKSPDKISIREMHRALFPNGSDVLQPLEMSRLFSSFSNGKKDDTTTLAQLILEK